MKYILFIWLLSQDGTALSVETVRDLDFLTCSTLAGEAEYQAPNVVALCRPDRVRWSLFE